MTVRTPNGSLVAIESGSAASTVVTGISNANPAVASSTAHGLATGDVVEIVSGWSRLTNKIVRVTNLTANTFSLDGIDTTLTSIYPAGGGGGGSVAKVTGFTQLSQILTSTSSGGDQQFLTYQLLEADAQKQIPTFKNPISITFQVADDPAQPGYILTGVANDDRLPRAVKVTLPDGSAILYNAYISLNRTPSLTVNQLMECQITLSLLAEVVRY